MIKLKQKIFCFVAATGVVCTSVFAFPNLIKARTVTKEDLLKTGVYTSISSELTNSTGHAAVESLLNADKENAALNLLKTVNATARELGISEVAENAQNVKTLTTILNTMDDSGYLEVSQVSKGNARITELSKAYLTNSIVDYLKKNIEDAASLSETAESKEYRELNVESKAIKNLTADLEAVLENVNDSLVTDPQVKALETLLMTMQYTGVVDESESADSSEGTDSSEGIGSSEGTGIKYQSVTQEEQFNEKVYAVNELQTYLQIAIESIQDSKDTQKVNENIEDLKTKISESTGSKILNDEQVSQMQEINASQPVVKEYITGTIFENENIYDTADTYAVSNEAFTNTLVPTTSENGDVMYTLALYETELEAIQERLAVNEASISDLDENYENLLYGTRNDMLLLSKNISRLKTYSGDIEEDLSSLQVRTRNDLLMTSKKLDRTKNKLDTKIDDTKTDLEGNISSTKTELEGNISSTKTELEGNISSTKTELNTKIDKTADDAKKDATTKANAAQSNAEATAANNLKTAKDQLDATDAALKKRTNVLLYKGITISTANWAYVNSPDANAYPNHRYRYVYENSSLKSNSHVEIYYAGEPAMAPIYQQSNGKLTIYSDRNDAVTIDTMLIYAEGS